MEQVQFSEEGGLLVVPVGRLLDGSLGPVPEKAVDTFNVQEYLYRFSGRTNYIDGAEATPPRAQLFAFLLHRLFNLQFQQGHSGLITNTKTTCNFFQTVLSSPTI
jgi:hypothetical protein